jgi:uncharacterized membrane protein
MDVLQEERNRKLLFIAFTVVLFLVCWGSIGIMTQREVGISYVDIHLEITNHTSSRMIDGTLFFYAEQGKSTGGEITIRNEGNKTREISISLSGEMVEKGWFTISESKFNLNAGEKRPVSITAKIPENTRGNYTAQIVVQTKELSFFRI